MPNCFKRVEKQHNNTRKKMAVSFMFKNSLSRYNFSRSFFRILGV